MKPRSKRQKVARLLAHGGVISGLSALSSYNLYRLSSVIHQLRQKGMTIETRRIGRHRYAEYWVPPDRRQELGELAEIWGDIGQFTGQSKEGERVHSTPNSTAGDA